jgi:diguanylate cyclase (GGDEF)-like protein
LAAARRRAVVDPLTGLANRAGLDAGLAHRVRAGQPYVVVLVDLDGFKPVNDRYGHAAGDAVLVEVAHRLAGILAGHDRGLVARLGGDEFVLVAASPAAQVSRLLGFDVIRALAAPVTVAGVGGLVVRASVGVVHAMAGDDPARALRAADTAMYQAKTRGGDAVVVHDPVAGLAPVDVRPRVRLRDMAGLGRGLWGVRA